MRAVSGAVETDATRDRVQSAASALHELNVLIAASAGDAMSGTIQCRIKPCLLPRMKRKYCQRLGQMLMRRRKHQTGPSVAGAAPVAPLPSMRRLMPKW